MFGIFDRSLTVSVGGTLGSLSCYRSLQKTRLNLIRFWLLFSSSFLLQTDESRRFQEFNKSSGSNATILDGDSVLNLTKLPSLLGWLQSCVK